MSELIIDEPIVDITDKRIYCVESYFRSKEYFGPTVEIYSYRMAKNVVLKYREKRGDYYHYMYNIYQDIRYSYPLFKRSEAEEFIIVNGLVYDKTNNFYSFLKILEPKINSNMKIKDIKKLNILNGYNILLNKNEKCSLKNSSIEAIWSE